MAEQAQAPSLAEIWPNKHRRRAWRRYGRTSTGAELGGDMAEQAQAPSFAEICPNKHRRRAWRRYGRTSTGAFPHQTSVALWSLKRFIVNKSRKSNLR